MTWLDGGFQKCSLPPCLGWSSPLPPPSPDARQDLLELRALPPPDAQEAPNSGPPLTSCREPEGKHTARSRSGHETGLCCRAGAASKPSEPRQAQERREPGRCWLPTPPTSQQPLPPRWPGPATRGRPLSTPLCAFCFHPSHVSFIGGVAHRFCSVLRRQGALSLELLLGSCITNGGGIGMALRAGRGIHAVSTGCVLGFEETMVGPDCSGLWTILGTGMVILRAMGSH